MTGLCTAAPPAARHSANSCVNKGYAVMDQSGLLGKHLRISSIYSYFNISNTEISASGWRLLLKLDETLKSLLYLKISL